MTKATHPHPMLKCLLALLLGGQLMASTEVLYGTIVSVGEGAKSVTIAIEMFNYTSRGEEARRQKTVPEKSLIYLDGQEATAAEALQVGRPIMFQDDGRYIFVSSITPGPDAKGKADKADHAIHRLLIDKVATLAIKGKRGAKDQDIAVELVLDVVDGSIADGVAITRLGTWANQDIDLSGLTFSDGSISGSTTVTLKHPSIVDHESLKITVTITGQSSAEAKTGDDKRTCKVTARALPRAKPQTGKVWMRLGVPGQLFRDHVFCVFALADGKGQTDGHHWYHKGKISGKISSNSVELQGKALQGILQSEVVARGQASGDKVPHTFSINARILGGRYVFGSLSMTTGEASHSGFVRGGLVSADSPVTGIAPEIVKLYAERFPKKKKK